MTLEMDAVDIQQQKEIDTLREEHGALVRSIIWAFVVFALLQMCTTVALIFSEKWGDAWDCPHKDCPHHMTDRGRDE